MSRCQCQLQRQCAVSVGGRSRSSLAGSQARRGSGSLSSTKCPTCLLQLESDRASEPPSAPTTPTSICPFLRASTAFLHGSIALATHPRITRCLLHSGAALTAAPPPPYDDTATLKAHALSQLHHHHTQCPTEPSAAKPRTQATRPPDSPTARFKKHQARPGSTSPPTEVSRKPCQQILRPRSSTRRMEDRRPKDTNEQLLPAHHALRCLSLQNSRHWHRTNPQHP